MGQHYEYRMPPSYRPPGIYQTMYPTMSDWQKHKPRSIDRTSVAAWALGFSIVGIFLYILCVPGLALGMYVAGSGDKYDKVRGKGMGIAAAIISGVWLLLGSIALTIIVLSGNLNSVA